MADARDRHLKFPRKVFIHVAIVALGGGVLFGYDLGIISGALLQLKKVYLLSCFQSEMVVSSTLFGALCGSFFGGYIVDAWGRKSCIIFSVAMFFVSAILLAFSPVYAVLIFGRLLVGFAIALSAASECVYVSELAPANIRGSLVSLNEVGITFGFLFSYGANAACSTLPVNGWRLMFGLAASFALVILYAIYKLPKSPRYLILQNQFSAAKISLNTIRSLENDEERSAVEQEFMAMNFVNNETNSNADEGWCNLRFLASPALLVGCMLVFFQQATGEPNLLIYASTFISALGYGSEVSANLGALGLGVVKVCATVTCLFLVDKFRRKMFLLIGAVVMVISTFILAYLTSQFQFPTSDLCQDYVANTTAVGTITTTAMNINNTATTPTMSTPNAYTVTDDTNNNNVTTMTSQFVHAHPASKFFALFFLWLVVAAYSFSFGPLNWIILSEIFPAKYRGRYFSIVTALNWGLNLVISSSFLHFMKNTGGLTFPLLTYGVIGVGSIFYIHYLVPETRGKTLEEIDSMMTGEGCATCLSCCRNHEDSLALPLIT